MKEDEMGDKRDTITYDLKDGKKIVYRGTTDDPERRADEHKASGKKFTKLTVTSRKMTEDGAKKKEAEALERYRKSHSGKNPKYNKDSDG
jgi:predicted GIY-YIG superfamily endonuclease